MTKYSVSVGDAEIISVTDGHIHFKPSGFFPKVEPEEWVRYADQLTEHGAIKMNVGSFVVRIGGSTALIDTGLGEGDHGFKDAEWGLLAEDLQSKGIGRDEIDTVIITHLHLDHVGWNTVEGENGPVPFFRNAKYLVPKADWDTFTRRAGMAMFAYIRDKVMSLMDLGVLELIDGEQSITDHLTALPTPGHTQGHTSVLVTSANESAVILGDAAHIPIQAHHTDWSPKPDTNPKLSGQHRAELFDRMEKDHSLVVSGHFPEPGFGRLVRVQGRRYWQAL